MKKNRLPRKLKKRIKQVAPIELSIDFALESIKRALDVSKALAICIRTPATQVVIDAYLSANRKAMNELIPLSEPVVDRHIRSFDLKGYKEEDYPRFNHVADAMDYLLARRDGYAIFQPSLVINMINLKTV